MDGGQDRETGDIFTADVKQETNGIDHLIKVKVQSDGNLVNITIEPNKTIQDLKRKLESALGRPAASMKLSISGRPLDRDGTTINEANINEESVVTLVKVQDITVSAEEQSRQNDDRNMAATVHARLNSCRILQRNFEACVDAAQTSKDPNKRDRYNHVETPTPQSPTARDFGYLVRDMANSLRTWSFQLHRLSDQLIRDEALPDANSREYQEARRLIQNNMDASRYMSPELQTFCQFLIPLGDEPPRGLAVIQNRPGSRRQSTVNPSWPAAQSK